MSSDSHLRIFDLRTPPSAANHLQLSIPIHTAKSSAHPAKMIAAPAEAPPSEALTHDWNKYRETVIATAGVDRLIRTFDLRAPHEGAATVLSGHEYAVRKLSWSPHASDLLLSASYDMTCRVWTDAGTSSLSHPSAPPDRISSGKQLGAMTAHTEFVTGVDWCLFGAEGWCASCGWDERLLVWDVRAFMGR